ncbi:ABC transporter permease [Jiangella asiatica]|uniref:ABC transporter permease n=1 Tax=Jiangella asiatica TaxID=2530372 RepID=A0A4R5DD33_9ACTN|nr:ABC transporter permease [Jiangella asiatica]TDE09900.1 hypothetical protein E1269_13065 [Jiangella asiatica]
MSRAGEALPSARAALAAAPYRGELAALVVLLLVAVLAGDGLPLGIASIGVVNGFVILLHAIAVILVYRTGRFVNFAQIQIGLVGAALYTSLMQGGLLVRVFDSACGSCIGPDPSQTVQVVNFALAVVLGLAASVLISIICYGLVVQRFARQSPLILTIATVFFAQILMAFQSQIGTWLTTEDQRDLERVNPLAASPPPWTLDIAIDPARIRLDGILTIATGLVAVVAIAAYLRYGSAGIAIRAAADNQPRARTLGINTTGVTARVWVLVGLLSGAAGILTAFSSGASGGAESEVVVLPVRTLVLVLAVAVVARFASLGMAALAAAVLGIVQESAVWSLSSTAPLEAGFVVIVGALLLLQRRRDSRADVVTAAGWQGAREPRPIPRELRGVPVVRGWVRGGGVIVAVVVLGLPWVLSPSDTNVLSVHLAYVLVAVSLLVLTGWAGQVSLGQFGFAAVGAWVTAVLELNLLVALPVAGLAGAAAAVVIGLPALKLRGLNLAIMTLAFAVSVTTVFLSADYLGEHLPQAMPAMSLFGLDLSGQRAMYYVTAVVLAAGLAAVAGLRRSRTGRALIAARDNEATVQSYGINLLRTRLTAFAFSGFLAAAAGAILAYLLGGVTPGAFAPEVSITLFAFAVIGGLGGLLGPVLGMLYLAVLTLFGADQLVQLIGSGLVGLLVLAALPGGIAQALYDARDAMLRRVAARQRIVVPSLFADRDPNAPPDQAPLDERRSRDRFLPTRFEPDGQWALRRYGTNDPASRERIGG